MISEGTRATTKLISKAYPRSQKSQITLEALDMIKLPWKLGAKPLEPRQTVNPRILELETDKQILEEILIIYRYIIH